jgi:hypothetical protein
MSDAWYYVNADGRTVGPVPLADLRHALAGTENWSAVLVWREGLPEWQRAGDVSELEPVHARAPAGTQPPTIRDEAPASETKPSLVGRILQAAKNVGAFAVGTGVLIAIMLTGVSFIYGATWLSAHALPYIRGAADIAGLICLFVLLPLALFRRTRAFAASGLLASSFVFGLFLWMFGLIVTMSLWGILAVVAGLMLFGVGVVPIGMVASLFKGEWMMLVTLVVGLAVTLGTRFFALWLRDRMQQSV